MSKNKRYRKAFRLDCLDVTKAKNETGGVDITTYIHRGTFFGDSEQKAIEWFKSILTQQPPGTYRDTINCQEFDLPERKDVWVKGFWIGYVSGFAFWAIIKLIFHYFNI